MKITVEDVLQKAHELATAVTEQRKGPDFFPAWKLLDESGSMRLWACDDIRGFTSMDIDSDIILFMCAALTAARVETAHLVMNQPQEKKP